MRLRQSVLHNDACYNIIFDTERMQTVNIQNWGSLSLNKFEYIHPIL